MKDLVFILDISLSMFKKYGDMIPSKIEASKEAILSASRVFLENNPSNRVGIVVFFNRAIPLLPLTGEFNRVLSTVKRIVYPREGSAPGDGIVTGVKMLRSSLGREKIIVLITDGDINYGPPLELAALYAYNEGVSQYYITVGEEPKTSTLYRNVANRYGAIYHHSSSRDTLRAMTLKSIGVSIA